MPRHTDTIQWSFSLSKQINHFFATYVNYQILNIRDDYGSQQLLAYPPQAVFSPVTNHTYDGYEAFIGFATVRSWTQGIIYTPSQAFQASVTIRENHDFPAPIPGPIVPLVGNTPLPDHAADPRPPAPQSAADLAALLLLPLRNPELGPAVHLPDHEMKRLELHHHVRSRGGRRLVVARGRRHRRGRASRDNCSIIAAASSISPPATASGSRRTRSDRRQNRRPAGRRPAREDLRAGDVQPGERSKSSKSRRPRPRCRLRLRSKRCASSPSRSARRHPTPTWWITVSGPNGKPVAVNFTVQVPARTPLTDMVYMATDQSNWNPQAILMNRVDALHYRILRVFASGTKLLFIFTRGSWNSAERGADGLQIHAAPSSSCPTAIR